MCERKVGNKCLSNDFVFLVYYCESSITTWQLPESARCISIPMSLCVNHMKIMYLSMLSQWGGGGKRRGIGQGFHQSLWPRGRVTELSCCPGGRWRKIKTKKKKSGMSSVWVLVLNPFCLNPRCRNRFLLRFPERELYYYYCCYYAIISSCSFVYW